MGGGVYWERQARPDSCRMHALNALVGHQALTWPAFMAACDSFDAKAGLAGGVGRSLYVANDENNTQAQHVLREVLGLPWCVLSLGMHRASRRSRELLDFATRNAHGALVFNMGHVWALRRFESGPGESSQWVTLDSLSSGPRPGGLDAIWKQTLGVELVFYTEDDQQEAMALAAACGAV